MHHNRAAREKLKLYNSLTERKEQFTPLKNNEVKMYVCGITPYDTTHLGHAFTYTFFDTLRKYLEYQNYNVSYTQNVTDIDDDILRKAKAEGKDWQELGKYWTDKFLKDISTLNIEIPTNYVKATDSIPTIIEIIKKLLEKSIAYQKEGNVYFQVSLDPEYGKLSHFNKQQMLWLAGDRERGANPDDPNKKNPLDFILWQKSKPNEPFWESPWGRGRPGWHIECSAMNYQYFGNQIDIHGGGKDLIYPHHESEIAQSEAFTDTKPFSQFWLHTALVIYKGEKMSKSLGNLIMVADLEKKYSPGAIRYVLLSHHYRSPWEFYEEELGKAEERLKIISTRIKQSNHKKADPTSYFHRFIEALDNDMNTPKAINIINEAAQSSPEALKKMMKTLGLSI